MPFSNPVVAGDELVRDAIRSPDYVPGVSGWSINRDGSAEFNFITVRGSGEFGTPGGQRVTISNAGVIQIYDSSNTLVGEWDASSLDVLHPTNGSSVSLALGPTSTRLQLEPPAQPGFSIDPALVYGVSSPSGLAVLELDSPSTNGGARAQVVLNGSVAGSANTRINLVSEELYFGGQGQIGRGVWTGASSAADSAAVAAETVVATAVSADFYPDRVYRATYGPAVSTSVAGSAEFRLHRAAVGGQTLGFSGRISTPVAGVAFTGSGDFYFYNNTASVITDNIVLTLLPNGAYTAQQRVIGLQRRKLRIYDWGNIADFPEAMPLT